MYKAEIIADSISPQGKRLTTFVITYPRIVHAEMCRHIIHSRNTASSRAIPFSKMVKEVEENPFIPIAWQKAHKGMQGTEYITDEHNLKICIEDWLEARNNAIKSATDLSKGFNKKDEGGNWIATEPESFVDGVTKQLCNRLLEPFVWVTEIISGTEWENFFELRCPQYEHIWHSGKDHYRSKKDYLDVWDQYDEEDINWLNINKSQADIHIQAIAELMWNAYNESIPKQLKSGEWHIPFGDKFDTEKLVKTLQDMNHGINSLLPAMHKDYHDLKKVEIATARCARVSYLNFEGKDDYEADIKLHDRLMSMKHWSPFEHCARVMSNEEYYGHHLAQGNGNPMDEDGEDIYGVCRNFRGFIQYRHMVENETIQ